MKEAFKNILQVFALTSSALVTWQLTAMLFAARFFVCGVNLVALVATAVMTVTMKQVCFAKSAAK